MRSPGGGSEKVETCLIILVLNNSSRIPNVINFPSVFFKFLDMLSGIFGNLVRPNRHVIAAWAFADPLSTCSSGILLRAGLTGLRGNGAPVGIEDFGIERLRVEVNILLFRWGLNTRFGI